MILLDWRLGLCFLPMSRVGLNRGGHSLKKKIILPCLHETKKKKWKLPKINWIVTFLRVWNMEYTSIFMVCNLPSEYLKIIWTLTIRIFDNDNFLGKTINILTPAWPKPSSNMWMPSSQLPFLRDSLGAGLPGTALDSKTIFSGVKSSPNLISS